MKEAIAALMRLDGVDRRLRDLGRERGGLPEERRATERAAHLAKEELETVEAKIRRLLLAQKAAEGEISKNAEAIGRHKVQQNMVKTTREYDALLSEIRTLQEKNDALSDAALEDAVRCEEMEERREALRSELPRLEEERERVLREIGARGEALDRRIAELREERRVEAGGVPPALLARYEKLLATKEGVAVARIERDACELCYRSVPPQRIIEVKKAEKIVSCEGCGRILVCE